AEWEYACRAAGATTTAFHLGNTFTTTHANFNGQLPYNGALKGPSLERTCPVGSYPPNALGLYDMHGNVYEWCSDWFDEHAYSRQPPGPEPGQTYPYRVLRGGAWCERAQFCRAAYRTRNTVEMRLNVNGLRVACEVRGSRNGRRSAGRPRRG